MKSMQTKALLAYLAPAFFIMAGCQTMPQTDPNYKNGSMGDCQPNEKEREFMEILFSDRLQKRKNMQCNAKLHAIAREKAREWAAKDDSAMMVDGSLLESKGYKLSKWLPSSYLRSAIRGYDNPLRAYARMIKHGGSEHFLAENPEYLDYNYIGVGYHRDDNSTMKHYFVFVSAPPEKIVTPEQRSQMKSKCEDLYRKFKKTKAHDTNACMQLFENECSDTLGKRYSEIVGHCGT